MKVVHLTNSITHSSAPLRLVKALNEEGIESNLIVLSSNQNINNLTIYKKNIFDRLNNHYISKWENKIINGYKTEGLPFSFGGSGVDVSKLPEVKNADIIHLHWINGQFLSFKSIGKIMKLGKPVIWTFHDSWPMTGGCHVRCGCDRFKEGCGKCHELNSLEENDITSSIILKKQRYYCADKIVTVSPSNWMYKNVCESGLFRNSRNYQIGNPIDTDIFYSKKEFTEFDQKEKIYILFGSSGTLSAEYKGYKFFVETMNVLKNKKNEFLDKIIIQIFGAVENNYPGLENFKIEHLGYINSDEEMAKSYREADIYVFPSLDDNLPGTVMECLACGTPVVCFDTCGIPEMVKHKENGYVARFKDSEDMARGIEWVYKNNKRNKLGISGKNFIKEIFEMRKIAIMHKQLYEKLAAND